VKDAAAQLNERLLVLRCQGGDRAALSKLIARYSPGLRLFLRKISSHATVADYLLQETWIAVYRKINNLKRPEAFAAWLYRIARDKAYSELRRRPSLKLHVDHNLAELAAADDENFAEDDAERVRTALDKLPVEHREVLVLRFVEEMSYEQIAEVTSCPIGTVRSRIHYAKLGLRTKLELLSTNRKCSHE